MFCDKYPLRGSLVGMLFCGGLCYTKVVFVAICFFGH